jgi:hypothetical protein
MPPGYYNTEQLAHTRLCLMTNVYVSKHYAYTSTLVQPPDASSARRLHKRGLLPDA